MPDGILSPETLKALATPTRYEECVACGNSTAKTGLRYCSNACAIAEDGPYEREPDTEMED